MKQPFFYISVFIFTGILLAGGWVMKPLGKFLVSLPTSSSPRLSSEEIKKIYGQLPMAFEVNQGQTDPQVKFLSRGNGYNLYLTSAEAVLSLHTNVRESRSNPGLPFFRPTFSRGSSDTLRMRFKGGNRHCRISGENVLPGKSNYFIGGEKTKWKRSASQYTKVRLEEVYPGVDMVYYGNQEKLEYDFVVKPGADPKSIRLEFQGTKGLEVDRKGNLVLKTKNGNLTFQSPVVYQGAGNEIQRVKGCFVKAGLAEASFEIEGYDKTKALIIDPTLAYSTYLGGSGNELPLGIAVDGSGNAYVSGYTFSVNFPTTGGAYQTVYGGGAWDIFVTKLNPTGSALVYSTYVGGSGDDYGYSIAVDGSGNAYVTGTTSSTNFPLVGPVQGSFAGGLNDGYVFKLNPAGDSLVFSTYLGGSGVDHGVGIAVDGTGNVYVSGQTGSANFPTTAGAFQTVNGNFNVFVTKLNPAGSSLVYSTFLGGTFEDDGYAIAVDGSGYAYVTGYTKSTNFPTTGGAYQTALSSVGSYDAFVTKLNTTGTGLVYSTYLGGVNYEYGYAIAVDGTGNAYVAGYTSSPNFPTTGGAYQTTYGTGADGFVTKLNPAGTALVYSTYLGGTGTDQCIGIALNASGEAYVTGYTTSSDFPTTAGAYQTTAPGAATYNDSFITKLNSAGTSLIYSSYLGGTKDDYGYAIAVDGSGDAYTTGYSSSSNFPTTGGAYKTTYTAIYDTYVSKFSFAPPTATPTGTWYTPTNSFTPTQTFTPTLTATTTPTMTRTRTPTRTPTNSPTQTPTNTVILSPSNTPTLSPTTTPTDSPTITFTSTNSPTNSPTSTASQTPTITFTYSSTYTWTITSTFTDSPTPTITLTPTNTATLSPTRTATKTFTPTDTFTFTPTSTITNTPTQTSTPSLSTVVIGPPYPNPILDQGPVNLGVQGPIGSTVTWDVFTTSYRKVAWNSLILSGSGAVVWDLKDHFGSEVANGIYYIRVKGDTGKSSTTKILKVVVLR